MDESLKSILKIVLIYIVVISLLYSGYYFWFNTLSDEQQLQVRSDAINTECSAALYSKSSFSTIDSPMSIYTTHHDNGTYSPIFNQSKICYYPSPDPKYNVQTKIVTVAGYEPSGWFSHCKIVTSDNEVIRSWNDDSCIYLTPGNRVELKLSLDELHSSIMDKRIVSVKIVNEVMG